MDEEIRNAYQKYAQQLLHRALEYLKQLEEEKDRLSGEKAEELLYEAMMCGDREERRDAAYCLGTLYRDFFPSPPDRKRALYFFSQSYLWGGVKSKQEFDRLREKYKIHISESELRMWKTDNTLGNVR